MIKLIASTFVENGSMVLKLNGHVLRNESLKIERDLEENKRYTLSWEVTGEVGSSYTLSISSPQEAEFHLTKLIGRSGEDSGSFRFDT